jgi:CubicO group peptidase (beta-lactamase class C family)
MANALGHGLRIAAVLLLGSATVARPPPSLGPGRGPWLLERPEPFGIPQATMNLVAERVQQSMAERYCLLVSLDGHLIHESYFRNRSETRYEADSLAKTMTAQIVGVAVAQGLIDLDKPLAEYGVEPRCPDDDAHAAERGWDKTPINATCATLLKGLCPNFAPPWDSSGRRPGHVTGPLPGSICTEGCTRRPDVRKAIWAANCSMDARRWCAPPGPGKGCWIDSQTDVDYWPLVTSRHLLTQTTGVGNYPPGTQFTYDSDQYIDHLAYLISKVTNESSQTWATREYALPMGLSPDVFAYSGFVDPVDGNEFSPGGGQMMSCRDHLRIGQLLINKGKWADDDGSLHQSGKQRPYKQLLTEAFVEQFLRPSFPSVSQSYGFLVWLNKEVNQDGCCSPRWGGHGWDPSLGISVETCHNTIRPGGQMMGDGMVGAERAPRDLALGMGCVGADFALPWHR